ncbi:MAG: hypothetical protein ACXAEI_18865 [Candidatus Hodarchaeales archaeon]|jgi:hypothetical protein
MKQAVLIELESLNDMARMLISTAPEQSAMLFCYQEDDKTVFSSLVILPGYYEYHALPVVISTRVKEEISGRFLRHDLSAKEKAEEVKIVDHFDEREISTGLIRFIPLIHLKEKAPFF